jgi:pimeloyl-ACP methyl ester carboxylesterase
MTGERGAREVSVPTGEVRLAGVLTVPADAAGVVLIAQGDGSGRLETPNSDMAGALQRAGLATLLVQMLDEAEEEADARTAHLRFDTELLARRVLAASEWLANEPETSALPLGYLAAGTGAAAALRAAAQGKSRPIFAVVSQGGRPDLALDCLPKVRAPTLLIVGGADVPVIPLNQQAYDQLVCEKELVTIPGASHLFEEPGALERVTQLTTEWFTRHVPRG